MECNHCFQLLVHEWFRQKQLLISFYQILSYKNLSVILKTKTKLDGH